jgi:hypothetical protein
MTTTGATKAEMTTTGATEAEKKYKKDRDRGTLGMDIRLGWGG